MDREGIDKVIYQSIDETITLMNLKNNYKNMSKHWKWDLQAITNEDKN